MISDTLRILAFAGSTRRESFNKKLVQLAATGAREAGAEATCIDLGDYRLPVFDQDEDDILAYGDVNKALRSLLERGLRDDEGEPTAHLEVSILT